MSRIVIGFEVKEDDFFEIVDSEKINCKHPEAEGPKVKFCPICGCAVKERVVKTKYLKLKKQPVITIDDVCCALDCDPPKNGCFPANTAIFLDRMDVDYMDCTFNIAGTECIFGITLSKAPYRESYFCIGTPLSEYEAAVQQVKKVAGKIFPDREIKIYHIEW